MGLFDFFKKSQSASDTVPNPPMMADLEHNPLQAGDTVESLRYGLGKCRLLRAGESYEYESLETGERVSWLRMVDAATQLQKVKKL
jgi:hypothetical protein